MTSAWKPGASLDDGRGNLTLVAHDGNQMRIERGDHATLIKLLQEDLSRYASLDLGIPSNGSADEDDEPTPTPYTIQHEPILQCFNPAKRPPGAVRLGRKLADIAAEVVLTLKRSPERTTALRKLREAQDCIDHGIDYKTDG